MTPDHADIEAALLTVVAEARASDRLDQLTVNTARQAAEKQLGLNVGFLKSHSTWNAKSKELIKAAVEDEHGQSPVKPAKERPAPVSSASSSKKRKSGERQAKPLKRRKSTPAESDQDEDGVENQDSSALSAVSSDHVDQARKQTTKKQGNADFESELSDVIDEPRPKKTKRPSKANNKQPTVKKEARSKAASGTLAKDADLSPDEAEIKRLQGWLLKCGIRKLWHRELAPFDSNKAKIKHLKSLLEDVGLTGRFSVEKASAIKERRELAAELEAVQEGNDVWGKDKDSDSDEEKSQPTKESPTRAVRKKPAASRFIDFGSDDEDE